jgi:hypothetical protein
MKNTRCHTLSIDFGGVIVRNRKFVRGEDTGLTGFEKAEVAQDRMFVAMREIDSICDGQVWIISKASPRMQDRTLVWALTTFGSVWSGKRRGGFIGNLGAVISSMITCTTCKFFESRYLTSTSSESKAEKGFHRLGRLRITRASQLGKTLAIESDG